MCKTVGEKLWTKLCPRTDGRTAMVIPVYPPPLRCWGYNDCHQFSERILAEPGIETVTSYSQVHEATDCVTGLAYSE